MMMKGTEQPTSASAPITSLPSMSGSLRSRSIKSAVFSRSQATASLPELAVAVSKPSLLSAFSTRRSNPASSSTIKMWAAVMVSGISRSTRLPAVDLGHLHKADEQAEILDGFREPLVVHRLHDVV